MFPNRAEGVLGKRFGEYQRFPPSEKRLRARSLCCSPKLARGDVAFAPKQEAFGRLGGGDLVRKDVVDKCRLGSRIDGAPPLKSSNLANQIGNCVGVSDPSRLAPSA